MMALSLMSTQTLPTLMLMVSSREQGTFFFWCGGPIVWRSTLQSLVAQSSCESELIALNACGKEAEWVRVLHAELTSGLFDHTESGVVPIMEDNTGAKALAENYYTSKRSRHFRVRLFHIRQQIREYHEATLSN